MKLIKLSIECYMIEFKNDTFSKGNNKVVDQKDLRKLKSNTPSTYNLLAVLILGSDGKYFEFDIFFIIYYTFNYVYLSDEFLPV